MSTRDSPGEDEGGVEPGPSQKKSNCDIQWKDDPRVFQFRALNIKLIDPSHRHSPDLSPKWRGQFVLHEQGYRLDHEIVEAHMRATRLLDESPRSVRYPGLWPKIFRIVDALVSASTRKRRRIIRAPGSRLDALARFIYPKQTYERVFQQGIIDMREEYAEALHKGESWHARWIAIRGMCGFFLVAVIHAVASARKVVSKAS